MLLCSREQKDAGRGDFNATTACFWSIVIKTGDFENLVVAWFQSEKTQKPISSNPTQGGHHVLSVYAMPLCHGSGNHNPPSVALHSPAVWVMTDDISVAIVPYVKKLLYTDAEVTHGLQLEFRPAADGGREQAYKRETLRCRNSQTGN